MRYRVKSELWNPRKQKCRSFCFAN